MDGHIVDSTWNLFRKVHQPQKYPHNPVIGRVNERFPGALYGWSAYAGVRSPPKTVSVPDQLVVCLTPEPWSTSHVLPLTDPSVRGNSRFMEDLSAWRKVSKRIIMREYYGLVMIFGPFPIEQGQAAHFKMYTRMPKVTGFHTE